MELFSANVSGHIMKTTNRQQRDQLKRQRELERALRDAAKYEDQQRAKLEVDAHNAVLESLLSVHHQSAEPIDWKEMAFALPPHAPAFYSTNHLRKMLSNFVVLDTSGQANVELQEMWQHDERDYLARCSDHQRSTEEWLELKNLALRILSGDTTAFGEALQLFQPFGELSELGSEIRFKAHDSKKVSCTLKINGLEIIPTETKSLTAAGKLSIKAMPKSKFHDIYQDFACGCCLRIGREIFSLLPVDYVLANIEVSEVEPSSGCLANLTILSVLLDRPTVERLNFCQLDPSDSMQNFISRGDVKISKKSGTFAPIIPLAYEELDLEPARGEDLNSLLRRIENTLNRYQGISKAV